MCPARVIGRRGRSSVTLAAAPGTIDAVAEARTRWARVQWHGKDWAVWVDTERKEVLAALTPADRYLTGL